MVVLEGREAMVGEVVEGLGERRVREELEV